jgi:tetratricopeptide (TPR) repeat protein
MFAHALTLWVLGSTVLEQADASKKGGCFHAAESVLQQGVRESPQDDAVLRSLCSTEYLLNRFDEALRACRKAVALNPSQDNRMALAAVLLRSEHQKEVEEGHLMLNDVLAHMGPNDSVALPDFIHSSDIKPEGVMGEVRRFEHPRKPSRDPWEVWITLGVIGYGMFRAIRWMNNQYKLSRPHKALSPVEQLMKVIPYKHFGFLGAKDFGGRSQHSRLAKRLWKMCGHYEDLQCREREGRSLELKLVFPMSEIAADIVVPLNKLEWLRPITIELEADYDTLDAPAVVNALNDLLKLRKDRGRLIPLKDYAFKSAGFAYATPEQHEKLKQAKLAD